jgi:hypothetical protein
VYSQNWTGVIRNPPPTPKSPEAVPVRIPVKNRIEYWRRGSMIFSGYLWQRYYIPGINMLTVSIPGER